MCRCTISFAFKQPDIFQLYFFLFLSENICCHVFVFFFLFSLHLFEGWTRKAFCDNLQIMLSPSKMINVATTFLVTPEKTGICIYIFSSLQWRKHALTHMYTHSHAWTYTQTDTFRPAHTLWHTNACANLTTHKHSDTCFQVLTLSHTHPHSFRHKLSLIHIHTHTHCLSLSLSPTHSSTHTPSLFHSPIHTQAHDNKFFCLGHMAQSGRNDPVEGLKGRLACTVAAQWGISWVEREYLN